MAKDAGNTEVLSSEEFVPWLRKVIGEEKVEDFAARLGFSKSVLYKVLSGAAGPGPRLCKKLRKFGLVETDTIYFVAKG